MKYLDGVTDKGIVLQPDAPGEAWHPLDGGGIREAILTPADGGWYLNYDGAAPGARPDSYWNACQAFSTDLTHWEKLGANLLSGALVHPDGSEDIYKDFRSASSPWSIFADGKWYHYYVGADHTSPDGTPAFLYSTLLATSETMRGAWHKDCDEPGHEKHVCFPAGMPGSWDDCTVSPGVVLENPRWRADPAREKRWMMLYSGCCSGYTRRGLGIARTDDLAAADDFNKQTGDFWQKDPLPVLPPEDDIENTSVFYEASSGLYWLFTNHIYDNAYTNSVWVYWSRDPNCWDAENKAVAVDASVSSWAKGAIGMPSVVQKDADTLTLLYDAVPGSGTGHLGRSIGAVEIALPLRIKD